MNHVPLDTTLASPSSPHHGTCFPTPLFLQGLSAKNSKEKIE